MFESGGFAKRKKPEEADLDITPMIDVTFLLLIFFMVTSTMQGTPDRDVPPSKSGTNAAVAGFLNVTVSAPQSSGTDGEILLEGQAKSLDELKADLVQTAELNENVQLMIYADRDVKSGFIGEIEKVVSEVANEAEKEILMNFAVQDRK